MAIGINDNLDALMPLCEERAPTGVPCEESLVWARDAHKRGLTIRQLAAEMATDAERRTWALWCRTELGAYFTHDARVAFADAATRDEPRMAAHLDIFFATSNTEGAMLSSRWSADEFPNIARQLEEGIVQRKRD